ncbi:hypothetical protein MYX84_01460, partial [Acidobacteria bacterium AH-259-O06]|nr:hypothetical protein [Acidobacteria bacterium AH-259-O06]
MNAPSFVRLVALLGIAVSVAASSGRISTIRTTLAKEAPVCSLEEKEASISLSNGLCRIVWNRTRKGWAAQYECRVDSGWETVAWDDLDKGAAYGVMILENPEKLISQWQPLPTDAQKALPANDTRPQVIRKSEDEIQIQWSFEIADRDGRKWPVASHFRLRRGERHIHEDISFQAPVYRKVRFQRAWLAKDIP